MADEEKVTACRIAKEAGVASGGQEMEPLECLKHLTEYWRAQYPKFHFIWNRELDPYLDNPSLLRRIRWIICADNPGIEEKKCSCYLAQNGRSGKKARAVIAQEGFVWVNDVIVLNKSTIYTPETRHLKKLPAAAVRATEEAMVQVILGLLARTKANLWIAGLGGCDTKKRGWPQKLRRGGYPTKCILPYFFADLRDRGAGYYCKERIFISQHFAHGCFAKEIKEFSGSLKERLAALPHAENLFAPPSTTAS